MSDPNLNTKAAKNRRTTIDDVAKLAGVGKVTVSYVLNGRAEEVRISPQTRDRVLAAARQLDYRPNALARMLVRQRTDTIGVVFQYADYFGAPSTFISELMSGVSTECVRQELDVLLHTKPSVDPLTEANALTDGRVDGALVLRDAGDPVVSMLVDRQFPIVLFFSRTDIPNVPFVDCDNFTGGRIAAEHLIGLGHTRLGVISGPENSHDAMERKKGFFSVCNERGIKVAHANDIRMETPNWKTEDLVKMMTAKDRPTALFVWSDDVAFRCMDTLGELGLSIPSDVSIVGFDSSQACDRVVPPLTSVRQPVQEVARAATRLLAEIVNRRTPEQSQIVFPLELDVRASTAEPTAVESTKTTLL